MLCEFASLFLYWLVVGSLSAFFKVLTFAITLLPMKMKTDTAWKQPNICVTKSLRLV